MNTAYVYKWTHIPTLKWYVGVRYAKNCHPNDGYICSSKIVKPMIQEHPEDWKREIISIGSSETMRELEQDLLTAQSDTERRLIQLDAETKAQEKEIKETIKNRKKRDEALLLLDANLALKREEILGDLFKLESEFLEETLKILSNLYCPPIYINGANPSIR